jgi:hypothetical protein
VLLPDGYPGRRVGSRVLPHPIFGVYLLRGYATRVERDGDARARAALATVAHAAVRRMRPFRGALVFRYDDTTIPLSRAGRPAYSALTQAYYAEALARAGRILDDRVLLAAAARVFASLEIPTFQGGVSTPGLLGPVLEEEPTKVPSAILNGWLSAIRSVQGYAALTGSEAASRLATGSARELARRLDRYDLPAVLGSAYSGLATVGLRLDVPVGTVVRSASLLVDGEAIPLRMRAGGKASDIVTTTGCGQVEGGRIRATCAGLELQVPVTTAGLLPTSTIRLVLGRPAGEAAAGVLEHATYDYVHDTGRTVTGWKDPAVVPAPRSPGAPVVVTVPVDLDRFREAQAPTTFKRHGGKRRNVYHGIHVKQLEVLEPIGGPVFGTYAERWRSAQCGWPGHPAYRLLPAADLGCR